MFLFGPPNIGKMKARRDVKGLIKALGYKKDIVICAAAAEALGEIGDTGAVPALIAVLENFDVWLLPEKAAEALGKIADERAVEPLITLLSKSAYEEKITAAAAALSKIGAPAVVHLILFIERAEVEMAKHMRFSEWRLIKHKQDAAVWALSQIKDPRAVNPLLDALTHHHYLVRESAARALGEIRDARAVDSLIIALKDKGLGVKRAAAEALGKIGDVRAIDPLIAALRDEDTYKQAARALDQLGWLPSQDENAAWYWIAKGRWDECISVGAAAVKPLITALMHFGEEDRAVRALVKIGKPAVALLVAALSQGANENIVKVLDQIGWEPGQDESAAWYWASKKKWDECGRIGEPAIRPLIACLLKTPLPESEVP